VLHTLPLPAAVLVCLRARPPRIDAILERGNNLETTPHATPLPLHTAVT
jgi:hypothetical protein